VKQQATLRAPSSRTLEVAATVLAVVAAAALAVGVVHAPFVTLLVGTAVLVGVGATSRPDLATLVTLAILYANVPVVAANHHGVPGAVGMALPLLLVAPLLHHVLVGRRPLTLGLVGPLLVLYGLVHLAATLAGGATDIAVAATLAFVTNGLALALLLVNVLRTDRILRNALLTIVVTAGALGAAALLHSMIDVWPGVRLFGFSELVRGDLLGEVDWDTHFSAAPPDAELRAAGPIGEANFFGMILSLALPYGVAFIVRPARRIERFLSFLATPCIAAGIVLTYSRGAILVLGTVAALLAVVGLVPRRTLLALAAGGVAVLTVAPDLAFRMVRLLGASALLRGAPADVGDAAIAGRYSEMVSAAHAWMDHPFLGLGPGMFAPNYQRYSRELGFDVHEGPREAHNLYLEVAAELGTIGLLVLLVLFAVLLRHLLATRRLAVDTPTRAVTVAGIATLAVIALNGMVLHLAFERYLWLHVAVLGAWCAVQRERASTPERLDRQPAEVAR
jgi:putative inorganic carbon (HCO3(-)) transporter